MSQVSETTTKLADIVKASMEHTSEAQRRMWVAADEVARLRRDLSAAEERLATAEREYDQSRGLTMMSWESLREDITRECGDSEAPSPLDAASGVPDLASDSVHG